MNIACTAAISESKETVVRLRLRVRGAVQGVGFRPFACGIAARFSLTGFVRNDAEGVLLEVEGARAPDFLTILRDEAPPLARIDAIDVERIVPKRDEDRFSIIESASGRSRTRIVADAATCPACLDELFELEKSLSPLSLHQLHRLRPALHDQPIPALRSRANVHGRLPALRGLRCRL